MSNGVRERVTKLGNYLGNEILSLEVSEITYEVCQGGYYRE